MSLRTSSTLVLFLHLCLHVLLNTKNNNSVATAFSLTAPALSARPRLQADKHGLYFHPQNNNHKAASAKAKTASVLSRAELVINWIDADRVLSTVHQSPWTLEGLAASSHGLQQLDSNQWLVLVASNPSSSRAPAATSNDDASTGASTNTTTATAAAATTTPTTAKLIHGGPLSPHVAILFCTDDDSIDPIWQDLLSSDPAALDNAASSSMSSSSSSSSVSYLNTVLPWKEVVEKLELLRADAVLPFDITDGDSELHDHLRIREEIAELRSYLKPKKRRSGGHQFRRGVSRKKRTKLTQQWIRSEQVASSNGNKTRRRYSSSNNSNNRQRNEEISLLRKRLEASSNTRMVEILNNENGNDDIQNGNTSTRSAVQQVTDYLSGFVTTRPSVLPEELVRNGKVLSESTNKSASMVGSTFSTGTKAKAANGNDNDNESGIVFFETKLKAPIDGRSLSTEVIEVVRKSNTPIKQSDSAEGTDTVRLVVLSDTHGFERQLFAMAQQSKQNDKTNHENSHNNNDDDNDDNEGGRKDWKLPDADILLHCGDFWGNSRTADMLDQFLAKQTHIPTKLVVRGNHDPNRHTFTRSKTKYITKPTTMELDNGLILELRPFRRSRSPEKQMPRVCDVLASHEPPFGICDKT